MIDAPKKTAEFGAAGATFISNGRQLPPPDPTFGGVIEQKASDSKAWWASRVVPPKGCAASQWRVRAVTTTLNRQQGPQGIANVDTIDHFGLSWHRTSSVS